jgi:uncharacterized protein YjbI with pentapeptide repeats
MAEERRTNPDDPQAIELSESEFQELQRQEAKKTAVNKKVLDSKDHLFWAILINLDLEGQDLHDVKMTKANLQARI